MGLINQPIQLGNNQLDDRPRNEVGEDPFANISLKNLGNSQLFSGEPQEPFEPTFREDDYVRKAVLGIGEKGKVAKGLEIIKKIQNVVPGIGLMSVILDKPTKYAMIEMATDMFTPAQYWRPEKREEFLKETRKDPQFGIRYLLMDTLWTELELFFISEGGNYAMKKAVGGLAKGVESLTIRPTKAVYKKLFGGKLQLRPVQDTIDWAEHSFYKAGHQILEHKGIIKGGERNPIKNITEREAILAASRGDSLALQEVMQEGMSPNGQVSAAFRDAIETEIIPQPNGSNLVEYRLSDEMKNYLDPSVLRRNYLVDEVAKRLESNRILNLRMGELTDEHIAVAVREVMTKYDSEFASEFRGMKLHDFDIKSLENVIDFLDNDHRAKSMIWKHQSPPALASLRPVRIVMEKMNPMYKTIDKVYKPIAEAMDSYSKYQIGKLQEFKAMLSQKGLMSIKKVSKDGIAIFERTPLFTPKIGKRAVEVLRSSRQLIEEATETGGKKAIEEAKYAIREMKVEGLNLQEQKALSGLLQTTYRFHDVLYKEYAAWRIPHLMTQVDGVWTRHGMRELDKVISEALSGIQTAFKHASRLPYVDKYFAVKDALRLVSNKVSEGILSKGNPWITPGEKRTAQQLADYVKDILTMGGDRKGAFKSYLEYDFPGPHQVDDFTKRLYAKISKKTREEFDELSRASTLERVVEDFDSMIASKIRYQGRQIALHDTVAKVVETAKQYPPRVRDYIGHYVSRTLGIPSSWDMKLATFLDNTLGRVERGVMKKPGVWDAARAMELSRNINDITYMGFLGFKPFSMMRNLFQPILMTPADLGGRGLVDLLRGYGKLLSKGGRERAAALRQMGIITDYGPEIYASSRFLNFGKTIKNIELMTRDDIRRFAMAMFRWSDEANRYVSGSAAWERFDWALKKNPLLKGLRTKSIEDSVYRSFMKKIGGSGRRASVADEIETFMRKGDVDSARALFVRDVVADTQYLYGGVDAPIVTHAGGAAGRTAAVFQTWWINYGEAILKWMLHGGTPSERVGRMANFMVSSILVYAGARALWGHDTAFRTVGAGPFPQPSAGMPLPPSIQPFGEGIGLLYAAYESVAEHDSGPAVARAKGLLNTSINFLPGGLQLGQTIRAGLRAPQSERTEAMLKSIIKYKGWGE